MVTSNFFTGVECINHLLMDGKCDFENDKAICGYDRADCLSDCKTELYDNGHCDAVNDEEKCLFDGGDCKISQCSPYIQDFIGDGLCQDFANSPECNYDGNDCCDGLTYDCFDCFCFINNVCDEENLIDSDCKNDNGAYQDICKREKLGDGTCNEENNNHLCTYDLGDCYFGDECLHDIFKGDGFCDEANNREECEFDGGDCNICFSIWVHLKCLCIISLNVLQTFTILYINLTPSVCSKPFFNDTFKA